MHLIETTNIDANEYNYFHSISSNEHMIGFIARLAIKLDLIVEYRSTLSGCWLTPSGTSCLPNINKRAEICINIAFNISIK
jgi:hypothetical protein